MRSLGRRWSNSAAASCRPLHWCNDSLAARRQGKGDVVRGDINEVLLAEASFGIDARGHRLRQINRNADFLSLRIASGQHDDANFLVIMGFAIAAGDARR